MVLRKDLGRGPDIPRKKSFQFDIISANFFEIFGHGGAISALVDSAFPKVRGPGIYPAHEKERVMEPQNRKAPAAKPKPSSTKLYASGLARP
jgi:hypothetical protein